MSDNCTPFDIGAGGRRGKNSSSSAWKLLPLPLATSEEGMMTLLGSDQQPAPTVMNAFASGTLLPRTSSNPRITSTQQGQNTHSADKL